MARVSIRGVAQRAGVSTMTVSRVLRGEGDSQHYDQVMSAVSELDYVPVRSAFQNRHIKTNTIGVLLDDEFVFDTPVGLQTLVGMTRAAFVNGYDLVVLQPKQDRGLEEQKFQVLDRRCDGFIFVVPFERPEVLDVLMKNGFPAVICYSVDVPPDVHCVVPDNGPAVRQAVELLRGQGHRKIAFWSAGTVHSDARERAAAYEEAVQDFELQSCLFDFDGQQLDAKMDLLLSRQITAVVCHNDDRALSLWTAAAERGLRIPRDLSIIGIDNTGEAARRGLTTFFNPFQSIGEEAVATMIALLEGREVREHCKRFAMPLVERASVGPPKGMYH